MSMEHETLQLTQEERGSSGDILDTTYYGGDNRRQPSPTYSQYKSNVSSKQCHNYKQQQWHQEHHITAADAFSGLLT